MYTKNLEQLLRFLQVSRQSGLLTVEKSEQDESFWRGFIRLVEGNVKTCQVCRITGGQVLFRDDEALRWLITQGKLDWHLEEGGQFPDALLPQPPLNGSPIGEGQNDSGPQQTFRPTPMALSGWTPRRTQKGMQLQARSLGSLDHLQAFILVNGQNSVEGIARLLRKPPQRIIRLLEDLRSAGLIE